MCLHSKHARYIQDFLTLYLPSTSTKIPTRFHLSNIMTDSGGFIKVPTDKEQDQMQKAAESSVEKRTAAKKEREMREAVQKAGESSKEKRKK